MSKDDKDLLVDFQPLEYDREVIKESIEKDDGPLVVEGTLQRANAQNQNGRVYPKGVLKEEAQRYMKEKVNKNNALGELDHPDSSVVNLKNVSHNVIDMEWEGNDLNGKIEILSTPSGEILKDLLEAGIRLGISSRGLGSVSKRRDGAVEVQDDFELVCFDFVSNPSTHGAFMEPINENIDREKLKEAQRWHSVDRIAQEIVGELSDEYQT